MWMLATSQLGQSTGKEKRSITNLSLNASKTMNELKLTTLLTKRELTCPYMPLRNSDQSMLFQKHSVYDMSASNEKGAVDLAADQSSDLKPSSTTNSRRKKSMKHFLSKLLGSLLFRSKAPNGFAVLQTTAGKFVIKVNKTLCSGQEALDILKLCHSGLLGDTMVPITQQESEKSGTMNLSVRTSVDYSMDASHSMIPNVDKIKEVKQDTDIQEKEQKESQNQTKPSTGRKGPSQVEV
ncbi:hypothetical protein Tco_0610654 [Tanacetum coccineum]